MYTLSFKGMSIVGLSLAISSALASILLPDRTKREKQINSANNGVLVAESCEAIGGDPYFSCCPVPQGPFDCHYTANSGTTVPPAVTSAAAWPGRVGLWQTIGNTSITNINDNPVDTTSQPGARS
ncbi:MAG: hypothetical protein P0Y53_23440 [Candidatus Pseudobacter hemicellulosilyticus]|uniref:Uncharacterized protein n=1 Tax=Candidatus Pseudobacter hemicellulosilyticus TaxID=3121375 RepID=A0AAJ5WRP1_9BACT|nr:MAG: hypothetical protein P0Y53_23440 [Pseudobacter sp.]